MSEQLADWMPWMEQRPALFQLTALAALLLACYLLNLALRHTDRFSTGYAADWRRTDTDQTEVDNYNAEVYARHRLFASLTSTIEGFSRFQDATFGDTPRDTTYSRYSPNVVQGKVRSCPSS